MDELLLVVLCDCDARLLHPASFDGGNQSDHGLVRVWSVSAVKKQSCVLMVGDALQVVTSVLAGAVVPCLRKAPQLSSFVYHSPGDNPRPC